jgi:hypothetical protein
MRKLFVGRAPNSSKRLVFNEPLMALLPLVMSDLVRVLGTQALRFDSFIAETNRNALALRSNTFDLAELPNQKLFYFRLQDGEEEGTEVALPYVHITDEMMRNALTVRTGVISEMGSTLIRAPSVFLQRAVVGGTDIEITAVQDDTGATARGQIRPGITATGTKIIARGVDGQG